MLIPITTKIIEEEIRREDEEAESQGTGNQLEVLQMKKSDPRHPQRNLYELKEMIDTFASLLWFF